MADGYIPDAELMTLIQRMVRQQMNSFQPRPKRLRRVRAVGGGGVSSPVTAALARVVEAITPATSNLFPFWGSGHIKHLDAETGEVVDMDPVAIYNPWPIQFPVDALITQGNIGTVPAVLNGTCGVAYEWNLEVGG